MNRTILCSKLHFFPVNSTAVLKHDNRLDFNVYLRNQSNCRKMKDNFLHFRKLAWYWMNKMFLYLKKKPYFSNWIFLFQNIGKKVYCGNWTLCWANQSCTVCMFDFEITHMISDQISLHWVQLPLFILITGLLLLEVISPSLFQGVKGLLSVSIFLIGWLWGMSRHTCNHLCR